MNKSIYGHKLGEIHHRSKASNNVVNEARCMREKGFSYSKISNALSIPVSTVRDWVNYVTRYAE